MIEIENEFLRLIPLDYNLLHFWNTQGRDNLLQKLGLSTQNWELEQEHWNTINKGISEYWLPQTKKFADNFHFYTLFEIVYTSKNISVGNIGFEGFYNENTLLVSYAISKPFRQFGLASEALYLLCNYFQNDPTIKKIRAYVHPNNIGSQKVLSNVNFQQIESDQAQNFCYELLL